MQITTKKIMKKVRTKFTRVVRLHLRACGWPEEVGKAMQAQFELEDMIEEELDRLAVKAGEL